MGFYYSATKNNGGIIGITRDYSTITSKTDSLVILKNEDELENFLKLYSKDTVMFSDEETRSEGLRICKKYNLEFVDYN